MPSWSPAGRPADAARVTFARRYADIAQEVGHALGTVVVTGLAEAGVYAGSLPFGIMSVADSVADPADLATGLHGAPAELVEAAATPAPPES